MKVAGLHTGTTSAVADVMTRSAANAAWVEKRMFDSIGSEDLEFGYD